MKWVRATFRSASTVRPQLKLNGAVTSEKGPFRDFRRCRKNNTSTFFLHKYRGRGSSIRPESGSSLSGTLTIRGDSLVTYSCDRSRSSRLCAKSYEIAHMVVGWDFVDKGSPNGNTRSQLGTVGHSGHKMEIFASFFKTDQSGGFLEKKSLTFE